MNHRSKRPARSARLVRGLAFSIAALAPLTTLAQIPSGMGVPSGVGGPGTRSPFRAGQGTNVGAGSSTGTGLESGGGNATGTGLEAGPTTGTGLQSGYSSPLPGSDVYDGPSRGGRLVSPRDTSSADGAGASMGGGVNTNFPGEAGIMPLDVFQDYGAQGARTDFSSVKEIHLKYARQIPVPGDRSLALSRVASAATFSGQLDMAEEAVDAAAKAAMEIPQGMIRDQRLISTVTAMLNLAEARLREGNGLALPPSLEDDKDPLPKVDRPKIIRRAMADLRAAADLAQKIGNPTYKNEMMYRVADGMSFSSQTIVVEYPKPEGDDTGKDGKGFQKSYDGLTDQMLVDAANLASKIERPVWRDRGLMVVAAAAAESKQFARALTVARLIPQPEVLSDALLKIAELQARRGDPKGATSTYKEAATAVASIPLDDPRNVLTGVLIDSLTAVGRFEDARASVALYPDDARRMVALGAIAESQGRRGSASSALTWINRDIPQQFRSQLYRRVNNGVVSAIEANRSRDLSNRGDR